MAEKTCPSKKTHRSSLLLTCKRSFAKTMNIRVRKIAPGGPLLVTKNASMATGAKAGTMSPGRPAAPRPGQGPGTRRSTRRHRVRQPGPRGRPGLRLTRPRRTSARTHAGEAMAPSSRAAARAAAGRASGGHRWRAGQAARGRAGGFGPPFERSAGRGRKPRRDALVIMIIMRKKL